MWIHIFDRRRRIFQQVSMGFFFLRGHFKWFPMETQSPPNVTSTLTNFGGRTVNKSTTHDSLSSPYRSPTHEFIINPSFHQTRTFRNQQVPKGLAFCISPLERKHLCSLRLPLNVPASSLGGRRWLVGTGIADCTGPAAEVVPWTVEEV